MYCIKQGWLSNLSNCLIFPSRNGIWTSNNSLRRLLNNGDIIGIGSWELGFLWEGIGILGGRISVDSSSEESLDRIIVSIWSYDTRYSKLPEEQIEEDDDKKNKKKKKK